MKHRNGSRYREATSYARASEMALAVWWLVFLELKDMRRAANMHRGFTFEVFVAEVVKPMFCDGEGFARAYIAEFRTWTAADEKSKAPALVQAAFVASALAAAAVQADQQGEAVKAWQHVADAQYWLGITRATWALRRELPAGHPAQLSDLTAALAFLACDRERKAESGRKGAEQRHRGTAAIKTWALERAAFMHASDLEIAKQLAAQLPPEMVNKSEAPVRLIYDALRARRKAGK